MLEARLAPEPGLASARRGGIDRAMLTKSSEERSTA